jgi:hypothetical protein
LSVRSAVTVKDALAAEPTDVAIRKILGEQ